MCAHVIHYLVSNCREQTDLILEKIWNKTSKNLEKFKTSPKVTMSLIKKSVRLETWDMSRDNSKKVVPTVGKGIHVNVPRVIFEPKI